MAERGSIQAKLNAGIEAVRAGDLASARRSLQQVISADPNNEIAWMWMASVVPTDAERRACLERALKINPDNTRAQEALRRLDATPNANPRDAVDIRAMEARRAQRIEQRGGRGFFGNPYLVGAGIVLLVIVFLVIASLGGTPEPVAVVEATDDPALLANAPTIDPTTYTATPFTGQIVTIDPAGLPTLPPTFTPTFTPTATETPLPSATPFALSNFAVLYTAGIPGAGPTTLYRIRGDGTGEVVFQTDGFYEDVALDPSGERIAFVRDLAEPDAPAANPQLFVAPLDDLSQAVKVTDLSGTRLTDPTWSPDGTRIAFSSDEDGDEDIWVIPVTGGDPARLTSNPGIDRDPSWSPDGATIAFVSDQNTPGFRDAPGSVEVYAMNPGGTSLVQLTDGDGDSFNPAWAPDNQSLVFVSTRSGDPDLYIMDANGQGETLLTFDDGESEDYDPVFLPDGRSIMFTSNRLSALLQLYVVDVRGSTVTRTIDNDRNVLSLSVYAQAPT